MIPAESLGFSFQKKFLVAAAFTLTTTQNISIEIIPYEVLLHVITGIVVALPLSLLIDSLSMTGELFDTVRGQSLDVVYAPTEAHSEHSLSKILSAFALCIGFSSGAFYKAIGFLSSHEVTQKIASEKLAEIILFIIYKAVSFGAMIILPYCMIAILIELIIATLTKIIPQSSLQSESFTVKMIVGFLYLQAMITFGEDISLLLSTSLDWVFLYV